MLKRIGLLAAGNALGQAIQLAGQPLLARLYPAAQFGVLGQMTAVSSVLVVGATLQLHSAVVLQRDEEDGARVLGAGVLSGGVVFVLACLGLVLLRGVVFGEGASVSVALATATLVIGVAYSNLAKGWQTRTGAFRSLAAFGLLRAVVVLGVQVALGGSGIQQGLVAGAVLGEFVAILGLVAARRLPPWEHVVRGLSPRRALAEVRRNSDFAFAGTLQELASVAGFMLPLYLVARSFSATVGGQFAMAHRLVWAPVVMLAAAISQTIYHHFATLEPEALRRSRFLRLDHRVLAGVLLGTAGAAVVPVLLRFLLGPGWSQAAEMSRWLVGWATAFLVSVPFRVCFRVLRCQRTQLVVDALSVIGCLAVFAMGNHLGAEASVAMIATIGICQNAALMVAIRRALAVGRAPAGIGA